MTRRVEILHGDRLRAVSEIFRQAEHDLRRDFLLGFTEVAHQVVGDLRDSAAQTLPRSGGLAALVADSRFAVRPRLALTGIGVGVDVDSSYDVARMDDPGLVMHPVYGGGTWVRQSITPGWFSDALKADTGKVEAAAQATAEMIAAKTEAKLDLVNRIP